MYLRYTLIGLLWLAVMCSGCIQPGAEIAANDSAITGGRSSSYPGIVLVEGLPLTAAYDDATAPICWSATGIAIAPNLVATAAHALLPGMPGNGCEEGLQMRINVASVASSVWARVRYVVKNYTDDDPRYLDALSQGYVESDQAVLVLEQDYFTPEQIAPLHYASVVKPFGKGAYSCGYKIVGRGETGEGEPFTAVLKEADVCLISEQNKEAPNPIDTSAIHFVSVNSKYRFGSGFEKLEPSNIGQRFTVNASTQGGMACHGDSGGALVDSAGKVVGIVSGRPIRRASGCNPEDARLIIGNAAPIVSSNVFVPSVLRFCRDATSAEECKQRISSPSWNCIPEVDDWCRIDGKLLPSCGQLGREFGWRRLGLRAASDWNDDVHGARLVAAYGNTGPFEQSIAEGHPWYRLDGASQNPFTLDDHGTEFPLMCGPDSRQPCQGDATFEHVWDADGCYLWYGHQLPAP